MLGMKCSLVILHQKVKKKIHINASYKKDI